MGSKQPNEKETYMRILFFDTETNGLPKNRYASVTDLGNWPRIIQIAWQVWELVDETFTRDTQVSYIVKPDESLVWNNDSAKIHGISLSTAMERGTPGQIVFSQFMETAKSVDLVVAHNISFDKPIVIAECFRNLKCLNSDWWPKNEYCSCINTKELCKLPSKFPKPGDKYKQPRLSELHTFLFGIPGDYTMHSADGDVLCLVACFQELYRRRVLPLDDWA